MKLLVATDGSSASDKAVDVALARTRQANAQLLIAHVVEPFYPLGVSEFDVGVFEDAMRKESEAIVAAAAARAKAAGVAARVV
jgi:nucleotide-binding universal stress UspA family protein